MIDTVIFDCDGVVLNTEHAWVDSTRVLLAKRGINYDPKDMRHLMTGKVLLESTRILKEYYNLDGSLEDLVKERLELVKELMSKEINFISGFTEFFNHISKQYKISMATSIREELFQMADDKLHLTDLFKGHIYFGERLKDASKPKPDIFLHAAKMTNSDPSTCLVIEDAPAGIQAGKTAGMKVVGITNTFSREKLVNADLIVDSFSEIDLLKF